MRPSNHALSVSVTVLIKSSATSDLLFQWSQQPAAAERISFSDSDNLIVAVAADRSSMT